MRFKNHCRGGILEDENSQSTPKESNNSRNSTPEPKLVFKDKKEAIEAFKDLLRERVSSCLRMTLKRA